MSANSRLDGAAFGPAVRWSSASALALARCSAFLHAGLHVNLSARPTTSFAQLSTTQIRLAGSPGSSPSGPARTDRRDEPSRRSRGRDRQTGLHVPSSTLLSACRPRGRPPPR
jgi:hypothetical protein